MECQPGSDKGYGSGPLWCADLGGTPWDFIGCTKGHSPAGNYTMSGHANYTYKYFIAGITFHAYPYLTFTVNANGGVTGTFYYDN